jgi:hypothetical protein
MATREELHQLVESLPDGAVEAAHQTLTRLQIWPPPPPPGRNEAIERFRQNQQRMQERIQQRMKPGECFVGGGGGSFSSGPGGKRRGRHGFGYRDGGDTVHETNIVHDDCEFTLIERIRRDQAAKTVLFAIEVTGPDATTARHEHRYPLP